MSGKQLTNHCGKQQQRSTLLVVGLAMGLGVAIALFPCFPPPPSLAASPKLPRYKRFADWCAKQSKLSAAERHTVEVLLQQAGSQDCTEAEQTLMSLTNLELGSQDISDLGPIASLAQLTSANLSFNQIRDISPLAHLPNLTFLLLAGNQIEDVSPLANLTNLTYLVIQKNQIATVESLSGLTRLTNLNALENPIVRKECPLRPATICIFTDAGQELYAKAEKQYQQGQFGSALETFQQVEIVYKKEYDSPREADTLNRIGDTYVNLSLYARALPVYQNALNIRHDLGDLPGIGLSLTSSATAYERLGKYDKSLEFLDKALINVRQQSQGAIPLEGGIYELPKDEGALFVSRALVYNKLGQHRQALAAARKALEKYNSLPNGYNGKRHGQSAAFDSLGVTFLLLGQPTQALENLEQALAIAQEIGDRAGEGKTLNHIGEVHASLGNSQQALAAYEQALASRRAVGDRAGEGMTLHNIGLLQLQQGKLAEATQSLRAVVELWESLRPGLADENKVSLFEIQAASYRALQEVLIAQQQHEAALEIAERGRARAFVELLASRLGAQTGEQLQQPDPPSIDDIRRIAQQQKATLVEYSIVGDQLYIWVIDPNGIVTLRTADIEALDLSLSEATERSRQAAATGSLRGGNAATKDGLSTFVRGLRLEAKGEERSESTGAATRGASPVANRRRNPRLQQSYEAFIAPIADLLPADPEARVIFVPQGALFLVPFAALQAEDGTYLIEKHTLLVAPSLQVLELTHQQKQQAANRNVASSSILVVGNPTMPKIPAETGGKPHPLFPLPGAEREAKAIADILGTQASIGEAATEKAVVEQMTAARIIHLATHGLLDELEHMGIGVPGAIALAPSGSGDWNDGLLTSNEILDLKLNADLVVLSACNTGRGKITGDGVIGLSRAFVAAGVPSAIVSLWPVPDDPTSVLMVEFYQQLKRHPDKARALRQAILFTMEQYPFTGDWAAFTLIGEAE